MIRGVNIGANLKEFLSNIYLSIDFLTKVEIQFANKDLSLSKTCTSLSQLKSEKGMIDVSLHETKKFIYI